MPLHRRQIAVYWLTSLVVLALVSGVDPAIAAGGSPAVSIELTNWQAASTTTSWMSFLEAADEFDRWLPSSRAKCCPTHFQIRRDTQTTAAVPQDYCEFPPHHAQATAAIAQPRAPFAISEELRSPIQRSVGRPAAAPLNEPQEWIDHIAAEPDDVTTQLSFRTDLGRSWGRLKEDTAAILQPGNVLVLLAAAGGAIAIHQDLDGEVREETSLHTSRLGAGNDALSYFGEITVQAPVIAGIYLWSLRTQNEELHDFSTTLISATAINGVSTTLLKYAVNSDRPSTRVEDGHYGFPSYHTSSSFTIASVLNEYYGWEVGLPAYAIAGLVGWSRIDERDHDVSDVFFGAALGYVIGTSVARHHLTGDSRVLLLPWTEPTNGALGVQWQWSY